MLEREEVIVSEGDIGRRGWTGGAIVVVAEVLVQIRTIL